MPLKHAPPPNPPPQIPQPTVQTSENLIKDLYLTLL